MQKVVGSVCLQIDTFSRTPRDFSSAVWRETANGLPKAVTARTSQNKKTLRFAGLSEAADGTRTHDLLHGNRLRVRHKRWLERFSAESDYRGLPGIRSFI